LTLEFEHERVATKYFRVRYLWLFAFCYVTVLSLLFQKFMLPLLPSLHAGFGLLKNDAYFYHQSAQLLAADIHEHGWSTWSLWSAQTNTSGNVAILAALYAIFFPDPALIIPVNAFFHATSAVVLLFIARELWSERVANVAGLIAAMLFIFFPSSLSWYSQPLKDSYVIAGVLLIFYSWIIVFRHMSVKRGLLVPLVWMAAGIVLVAFVKPYYLKLLLAASVLTACSVAVVFVWSKHQQRFRILSFYLLVSVSIVAVIVAVKPNQSAYTSGESYAESGASAEAGWSWKDSSWLPGLLDKNLKAAAETRLGMIQFNQKVGAGSLIDENSKPQSAAESVGYFPRALQIGLFAPFPDSWLKSPSVTRIVVATETLIWYLMAPGLLFAIYYWRSPTLVVVTVFVGFFLTVFSFVTPNIGTLYRHRYVFEFLLILIGLAGWTQFYFNHGKIERAHGSHRP
jgi:putative peptidoglycan lipid II flippase